MAQGASGAHDARRHARIIARAQHRWQGDHPHSHNCGTDNARGGGKKCPDENHRNAQAPAQLAKQTAHGVQQFFGNAAFLQNRPHKDKQGNGDQHVVGQQAKDALPHCPQQRDVHFSSGKTDIGKNNSNAGDGKGHRKAQQNGRHQDGKHD